MDKLIRGYKVFNNDWTCRGKQYTCPGKFEEDVEICACERGIHFCKKAVDCFNYYSFDPENKVAEVIAYGEVDEYDNKCCTNKLEIVREIPWNELLEIVNFGENCTGLGNDGDYNSGNFNSGNYNSGDYNSGNYNSGSRNSGNYNSGNHNSGACNSGAYNSGNFNSGSRNSGNYNSGNYNSGSRNSGDYNSGYFNSGDWNECDFSNGCFNTVEPKIYLFNKPSEWTYRDWLNSDARRLLNKIPTNSLKWVSLNDMTDEEKNSYTEAETTTGYLKNVDNSSKNVVIWWESLSEDEKEIIKSIPNFDEKIFKEITGISSEVKL